MSIWSSHLDVFPAGIQTLLPLQCLNKIMWNIERKGKTAVYRANQWKHFVCTLSLDSNLNLICKQRLQRATSTSHVHLQHFQGGTSQVSQLFSQLLKGTCPTEEGFSCFLTSDELSSQMRLRKTCSLSFYFHDQLPSSNLLLVPHRTVKIPDGQLTTLHQHTHPPSVYYSV